MALGIEQSLELVGGVKDLTGELKAKSDDGVINLSDIIGLSDEVKTIIDEAQDMDEIKAELKDLDPSELKDLIDPMIDIVVNIAGTVKNKPKFKLV